MSFARYAILVLALVALGLVTVWGHLRLISIGYEMNELRNSRDRLDEEARVLDRRIDALATPSNAAVRVRSLELDLNPPSGPPGVTGTRSAHPPVRSPSRPGAPSNVQGGGNTRVASPHYAPMESGRRP